MKYRADVDGLRALAVLPVVLFHSGFELLSGGYVGVDIFFVISGFVITSRLVEDLEKNRYSIAEFYVRRIRRIMPALVATVVLSFLAGMVLFLPDAMYDFSRSIAATALFVSNIYFWKTSGYFETAALDRPLLHTWSLSVEEQFYIVIPIALWAVWRFARSWAWPIFALGAAASLALSIYVTDKAPTANFFLLPTRAWELLLGSLLVMAPLPVLTQRWLREAMGVLGLALIAFAIMTYTESTAFPGVTAVAPTLGAALLIYSGRDGETLAGRLLSIKPMVWIGLISYSLYLVHWPIIVFARYALLRDVAGWEVVGVVALSILLAWASYRFVEQPFRKPMKPLSRAPLFGATAGILAAAVALGASGMATQGFAVRHPTFKSQEGIKTHEAKWLAGDCFLENQGPADWKGDACVRTIGAKKNALLWGDSFAAHYVPGLIHNQGQLSRNIVQYTFAGCPPILSYQSYARPGCQAFNGKVFEVIDRYDIDTVVISARWDQLRQRGVAGLDDTVRQLKAKGVDVYVLGYSPMFAFDVDVLDYRQAGAQAGGPSTWNLAFEHAEVDRLKTASGAAHFIDPLAELCRGEGCAYKVEGSLLFDDFGHYSEFGSDLAVRAYFPLYTGPRADALAGSAHTAEARQAAPAARKSGT
jgi:peptidoglycan/LPS O-acetylase OafA/YrhL